MFFVPPYLFQIENHTKVSNKRGILFLFEDHPKAIVPVFPSLKLRYHHKCILYEFFKFHSFQSSFHLRIWNNNEWTIFLEIINMGNTNYFLKYGLATQ
jgi:hypothetical protein